MKRKKVLMTTVAMGTTLLGANVQADEVDQQLPPVSETSLAVANEVASTNPVAQASADVEKLQLELEHQKELAIAAQEQVTTQSNLVASTQESLKEEEQAVVAAKEAETVAKDELKQVTTDQILALEKEHPEIALVLNEFSQASAQKAKLEQDLANQETILKDSQATEASTVEKQEYAQAEVRQAQSQLGQATENFNQLGQKQVTLSQQLKEAQGSLSQSEADLAAAQTADHERDLAIATAEKELAETIQARKEASSLSLEQARRDLNQAQEAERLANQDRNAAAQSIKNLESRLATSSPEQAQLPRIEIMSGYNLNMSTADLLAHIQRNGGKNSQYRFDEKKHTTSSDRSTMINVSNLSERDLKELNEYGIRILNQMKADYRNKTGQAVSSVVLSIESIDQAQIVADTYEVDRFNNFKEPGHNENAFDKALAYRNAINVTEDINAKGPYNSPNITKAAAKKMVYDALYNMIYKDDHVNYSHARSILGLQYPNEKYLGLAFSYVGAIEQYPGTISVHITKTNGFRNYIPNTAGFINTEAEYAASDIINRSQVQVQLDEQRQHLTRATANLTLAQTNQTNAQSRIDSLIQALRTDDTAVVAKREALSKAQAITLKTPAATSRHQQNLALVNRLEAEYAQLETDILSKKVVLDNNTQVLADKIAALEAARQNLVLAKGRVEVETTKVNFLKGKVEEAVEQLGKLETAKRNLLKEKYDVVKEFEAYQTAKVALLNAQDRLAVSEERVNALKTDLLEAQAKLNDYQEAHRQALAKQDQIKADLADKTKSLAELEKLSKDHHLSSQNGILIAIPKTDIQAEPSASQTVPLGKEETSSAASDKATPQPLSYRGQETSSLPRSNSTGVNTGQAAPSASSIPSTKTLPNTGEKANGLTMLAGASLLAGLAASKRRREEEK